MRSIYSISTAIAFLACSVMADNAGFNPVNFAAEVNPEPTSLNEDFSTFRWNGDVSLAKESFEIDVENAARIQITDYKNRGDMFEIFDNDMSLGYTSKVETTKDDVFAATPEEALQDDRFSKGVFELSKGKHIITIKAEGPHEAGTAAIRVLNHAPVSFGKKKKDSNKKKTVTVTETLHVPAHTKHKHPIEFDTSHTITRTKTNWVVVTPTSTSVPPIYSPMYPPQGYPEYPPQHPEYPPNHWEDEEDCIYPDFHDKYV